MKTDSDTSWAFLERYQDEAALEAHRKSDRFRTIGKEMGQYMDGKPELVLSIGEWASAYADAKVFGCPGLAKKRADVTWTGVLGDGPEGPWEGELDQVFFGAYTFENEVVFFHRASRTLISSDLIFNLSTSAARSQIDRMLAWSLERIVLAHGDIVASDGRLRAPVKRAAQA